MNNKVAILLGSENDMKYVEGSYKYFDFFDINVETHVISAHRNPDQVAEFTKAAPEKGYSILIGSAGMAAHLAGALKAHSILPVIGVPLPGGISDGMDSLLSTVQMPKGVPVATMSIGKAGAINAAVYAAKILSLSNNEINTRLTNWLSSQTNEVPITPKMKND